MRIAGGTDATVMAGCSAASGASSRKENIRSQARFIGAEDKHEKPGKEIPEKEPPAHFLAPTHAAERGTIEWGQTNRSHLIKATTATTRPP